MASTTDTSGKGWAYTGAILGGLVSVAANVAHSYIRPAGAPVHWRPEIGAVVGAIVWPVFLFIAVEILARVAWPSGKAWTALRFGGMLPVAIVAAFVSYKHLSGLLAHYGEQTIVSALGPLAVDGLMVMATGALLAISARTRTALAVSPASPVSAPVVTVPVTPAAPAADAWVPVAPVPANQVSSPAAPAVPVLTAPVLVPPSVPAVAFHREPPAPPASPAPFVPAAPAQATAPATADIPVAPAAAATPLKLPVPGAMLTRATHLAEAHRAATGKPITAGELAVRLRVNSEIAAQLLALLDLAPGNLTASVPVVNGHTVGAN